MKATKEQIQAACKAFEAACVDRFAAMAKSSGSVSVNTETIRAVAFPAVREVIDDQLDPTGQPIEFGANQVCVVWESLVKINGSAMAQMLERRSEAGLLTFKVSTKAARTRGIAMGYAAP